MQVEKGNSFASVTFTYLSAKINWLGMASISSGVSIWWPISCYAVVSPARACEVSDLREENEKKRTAMMSTAIELSLRLRSSGYGLARASTRQPGPKSGRITTATELLVRRIRYGRISRKDAGKFPVGLMRSWRSQLNRDWSLRRWALPQLRGPPALASKNMFCLFFVASEQTGFESMAEIL